MGVDLQYDLNDIQDAINKIQAVRDKIDGDKTTFKLSFEKLRIDWNTDAGVKFFEKFDGAWTDGIDECIAMLDSMITALTSAKGAYEEIETEANNKLKF